MLLSWNVSHHQSWEIGQWHISASVWVYIETNWAGCFDMRQISNSVSRKVCFGTECDLLSFTNEVLFVGNKFEN